VLRPTFDLVLASTSPYRAALLARLDVPFRVMAPAVDESTPLRSGEEPAELAARLARLKAESVRDAAPGALILGADQVAALGLEILGKPGTPERAVDTLVRLSGRTHELVTAVTLLDAATGQLWQELDRKALTMRAFGRAEAERYVARHRPLDCAGAYRIEDAGIALIERIEGSDDTGIVGLPLLAVCRLLRAAGCLS
jgi:septum formation protein